MQKLGIAIGLTAALLLAAFGGMLLFGDRYDGDKKPVTSYYLSWGEYELHMTLSSESGVFLFQSQSAGEDGWGDTILLRFIPYSQIAFGSVGFAGILYLALLACDFSPKRNDAREASP